MKRYPKLVVVGQTPPPYNGQAKMIRLMIEGLTAQLDLVYIRMAYSDSVVSAGKFGLRKIKHLLHLICQARVVLKQNPGAVLYYPPASPNLMPVLRDICFLCAVRPLAAKTVFHFHSGGVSEFVREHRWLRGLAFRAYGAPDLAIELGKSCPRDGSFFKARRVAVVPNGADVVSSGESGSPHSVLRILYVGIHTASKGLFDLLAAADELNRRGVSFEIRTAGLWYTQRECDQFDEMRRRLGLQESVLTLGQKTGPDLDALYGWADVFFFPTFYRWETFGLVQIEAMANGLPVVASDWAGPRDVIVHGVTGFLCPPHDIEKFADALQRLASDESLREAMGAAGRKRYRDCFTAECFINKMVSVLSEVCA